jgi:Tfp pilus assembly protein PilF
MSSPTRSNRRSREGMPPSAVALRCLATLCGLAVCGGLGCASWPNRGANAEFSNHEQQSSHGAITQKSSPSESKPKDAPSGLIGTMAEARIAEDQGKLHDARKIYERLIAKHPDRPEPYHRLGVVADRERKHREAQNLYAQAIERQPTNAEALNDLGYCFYLQGQLHKAESALLKAVGLAPSSSRYRNNLGLVYGHLGRRQEALDQFRRAGSEADAQYNMAFVHASRNESDAAKACFTLALASDPTHEPARRALASFSKYELNPEGAEDLVTVNAEGQRLVPFIEASGAADAAPAAAGHSALVRAAAAAEANSPPHVQSQGGRFSGGGYSPAAEAGLGQGRTHQELVSRLSAAE